MAAVTEEKHPHLRARRIVDRIVLGESDGVMEEVAATAGLNGVGADFRTILFAGLAFAFEVQVWVSGKEDTGADRLSRRAHEDYCIKSGRKPVYHKG